MVVNGGEDHDTPEHSKPSIRVCKIEKQETGSYGFHLTRTKWDPYPWIAGVDNGSVAQISGLKIGDCVLEVNGEDVIGLRVGEIASKALSEQEQITMLLWNAGSDQSCDNESLCCTPMPTSLSRLSSCLSSILSFLECPVCFEIICPPAHQCPLGHLICFKCREEIERCPVCRTTFTRERSLLADQIYTSVIEAFHLKNHTTEERTKKLWERVFGKKKRDHSTTSRPSTPKLRTFELKNKFLTRLIGKSSSVDNLPSADRFTPSLRKKSISSSDLYPSAAKRANYMYDSGQCSTESLPNVNEPLSKSPSLNSCDDGLGTSRSIQYYSRARVRNLADNNNAENLFQFSSNAAVNDVTESIEYRCPLSEQCPSMSSLMLLAHLQEHDGPVIQYFKPNFSINFPFSFENGVIFIVNCHQKSFFLKLHFEPNNDVKLYVWILGTKTEAEQFKIACTVRGMAPCTELSFVTYLNSILFTESLENVYNNQILITNNTLENSFPDKSFIMNLEIITK